MAQSALLLHSPADVIARMLIAMGYGVMPTTPPTSWSIHVGNEPAAPDNAITVYNTSDQGDGRSQITGERWQHYGFQIRVRSASQPVGYVKAQAIAVALDEDVYQEQVTVAGSTYLIHSINRTSEVLHLGREKVSDRDIFTINGLCCLRLQT